jgi:hypothetical protein
MTTTGLSDLDELVLTCRTERARAYIQEALIAYRGGAYRAAIVSAWIAVVFDLIDKLRELDLAGDAQAKQVIGDFDKQLAQLDGGNLQAIPKALEFEREVLTTARDKFQLFDQQQFIDLSRLRDDRNRCAHPTFQREGVYQPSAELARTHIRNAIEHALRQSPVQGRSAIESVLATVASEFFPKNVDEARVLLSEGPLGKPTPALVNGVVDRLIWDLFTPGSPLYRKLNPIPALMAIIELHRAQAEPRLASQARKLGEKARDDDLPLLALLATRVPEFWNGLSEGQRNRVSTFVRNGSIRHVALIMRHAFKTDYLREPALARLAVMEAEDLAQVVAVRPSAEAVARAVELFSTAGSWPSANMIADRLILPLFDHLTPQQVRAIIRSPRERGSDLRGSGGLQWLVEAVRKQNLIPKAELNDLLREENLKFLVEEDEAQDQVAEAPVAIEAAAVPDEG